MALPMVDPRINPATGLPWDEGDSNAPALPAPESFNDGSILGGGGSAAPAPVAPAPAAAPAVAAPAAASIFPAKPTYEDKTSVKTRVKSAEDLQAEANLAAAEGKTDTAQHRVGTIEAAEGDATFEGAGKLVDEKQRQLDEHAAATKARRELGIRNAAADDNEIEQVKQARIAAGGVRQHAYDGRTAARVFSAILQGISVAAEGIAGRSGPTPLQRIYEDQYAALEKTATGKADALQEAHEGKAKGRAKSEAEADREAIERKNHALLSVELIDEQLKQAIAALSPDKAKAANALREATTNENRARLRGERTALYDKMIDRDVVNRSETSSGSNPANRPLSTEAKDMIVAASNYEAMKRRQAEIIRNNGGKFPVAGADATEFETNEKKMATIIQKPLGKSGPDAEAAKDLQNTPSIVGKLASQFGRDQGVENYLRSLDVNGASLSREADKWREVEGKPDAAAAPAAAPKPVAAPAKGPSKTEIMQAKLWLKMHANDPAAEGVRAALRKAGAL